MAFFSVRVFWKFSKQDVVYLKNRLMKSPNSFFVCSIRVSSRSPSRFRSRVWLFFEIKPIMYRVGAKKIGNFQKIEGKTSPFFKYHTYDSNSTRGPLTTYIEPTLKILDQTHQWFMRSTTSKKGSILGLRRPSA